MVHSGGQWIESCLGHGTGLLLLITRYMDPLPWMCEQITCYLYHVFSVLLSEQMKIGMKFYLHYIQYSESCVQYAKIINYGRKL